MLDVNAFTRSKVLQVWSHLCDKDAIPKKAQPAVVQLATARLEDKSAQVDNHVYLVVSAARLLCADSGRLLHVSNACLMRLCVSCVSAACCLCLKCAWTNPSRVSRAECATVRAHVWVDPVFFYVAHSVILSCLLSEGFLFFHPQ